MRPRQRPGKNGGGPNRNVHPPKEVPSIVISEIQRKEMLADFLELPKIRIKDSLPPVNDKALNNVIGEYLETSNFRENPKLNNPNHFKYFTNCVERVYGRKNILFSIDVEAWELNTNSVTELGISIYDPRSQVLAMMPTITQIHIKIRENLDLRNGRYVPDHADNFVGGVTYVMSREEAVKFTQTLVDYYFFYLPQKLSPGKHICSLVGHGVGGDIKWFTKLGIKFPQNMNIVDTQNLFTFTQGDKGNSLKNGLIKVEVPNAFLHNAGNDAYYTLILAMKLCDPICRDHYRLDKYMPLEIPFEARKKSRRGPANRAEMVELDDFMGACEELF
jgi:hypothetical protein